MRPQILVSELAHLDFNEPEDMAEFRQHPKRWERPIIALARP